MDNRFVDVVITRQTKAVSQAGFGLSLILSHEKLMEYKEYTGIEGVATDYGESSETYKLANSIFSQVPRPQKLAINGILYDGVAGDPADLVAALNLLMKSNGDFFYVHCTEQSDPVITAVAAWVNTQDKFYFASTTNKVLHVTLQSQNTILMVHPNPETYPAAAWVGVCSPQTIGTYTWTFKTLNGILPAGHDETDLGLIEAGASSYIRVGGVNITSKGVTTTGEYIDILQGQYFIKSRMTESVFALLVRLPKVPYTYDGIAMMVAEVEGVLKRAANQGIIAKDADGVPLFVIHIPNLEDISDNDKADRVLPDLNWEATIAGAVEKVRIGGVLQL